MKKLSFFAKLFFTAVLVFFTSMGVNSQVTIGSGNLPSDFSLLDLDASVNARALHLPRLTSSERDALVSSSSSQSDQGLAIGLMIYNTDNDCVEFWNSIQWISLCEGDAPSVPPLIPTNPTPVGNLTAWTNAMYDFQSQRLRLFGDAANENATEWQWQVRSVGADWQVIPGATSADFTIPVDFVYDRGFMVRGTVGQNPATVDHHTRELSFRLVRVVGADIVASHPFNMLFIRTNTSGYTDVNGVRGLALNRGGGGFVRFALLNVGAENDNSLGYLFQWGRMADGHQRIGWAKNLANGANLFDTNPLADIPGNVTSDFQPRPTVNGTNYNMTTGQLLPDSPLRSVFLTGPSAWGTSNNNVWGNGSSVRPGTGWTFPTNNPCPAGWRVPTRWEFWDIGNGTGADNIPVNVYNIPFNNLNNNNWSWRAAQNGAAGGVIIANPNSGEVVFFPAMPSRLETTGLQSLGPGGGYWSSTFSSSDLAWVFGFSTTVANPGSAHTDLSAGRSVRCVAE